MKFNFSKSHGSYRIRFTHEGKRRDFRPGTKDEAVATAIVKQMTYEWETGQFDPTLERYKVKNRDAQINPIEKPVKHETPKGESSHIQHHDRFILKESGKYFGKFLNPASFLPGC